MRPLFRRPAVILCAATLFTALGAAALAESPPPAAPSSAAASDSATPAASDSATPAASGSATPAASGSAIAKPAPPPLSGADIPAEPSKKPTEAEWRDGKKVRPQRGSPPCELILVREWLRVTCAEWVGVGLVAGDPKDVTVWTSGAAEWDGLTKTAKTMAQFPLARGASRIFNFMGLAWGYDSVSLGDAGTMSVVWREGDADPAVRFYPNEEPRSED